MSSRPRIVVVLPDVAESSTVADWLVAEGLEPVRRGSARGALDEIQARPFSLMISDAHLAFAEGLLAASRARNPQTPAVVVGGAEASASVEGNRHAMFLSRPLERGIFTCTVSMAMLDGRPVRRSPRKPVNRFQAVVNGVPSHILDVSKEGLRLELPRDRVAVPPPYFSVRVPIIGVAVTVQRMWARACAADGGRAVTWCGGTLTNNRAGAEQGWRSFVETLAMASQSSTGAVQIG